MFTTFLEAGNYDNIKASKLGSDGRSGPSFGYAFIGLVIRA